MSATLSQIASRLCASARIVQRHVRQRARASAQRGVAMIIAVVAIAVLTVVATEFAYNSRVDLQLAANQRDEIRAYYLARSGIGLSRLLLRFQKQIDGVQMPNLAALLGGSNIGGTNPATPGQPSTVPGAGGQMTLQLWRMARVDCYMLRQMVREPLPSDLGTVRRTSSAKVDPDFADAFSKPAPRSFGGFDGCFQATIGDEEEKLNLNKLDAAQNLILVQRLVDLLTDKRFEFLFEREDSNKLKVTALDVLIAMRDWIDEDEVQSTLNLASLNQSGMGDPFVKGFSDENSQYDKYSPRYKAKNARLDSLDELYMVHGVNDRFMAAFRDRFTVYPDVNAKLNINTDDPMLLQMAILSVADPSHPDPRLRDPVFVDALIQRIRTARMMSFLGMSVLDFISVIDASGIPVNPLIRNNVQNNTAVSDKTNTYSIKSVGEAGSVQKTISAVVRMDDQGLGRLVYWREE
ncbi:MAG TPA: type II secretion system minor pseudopilin GspK [Myxococcaceae bacterium]|nr:type II secretion system minor pseudopilin GspK [Myxococcaceae bacterium]